MRVRFKEDVGDEDSGEFDCMDLADS